MQQWFFTETEENARLRAAGEDTVETPTETSRQPSLIDTSKTRPWLFQVHANDLRSAEVMCVTGSCEQLGNWQTDKVVPLVEEDRGLWCKTINIPVHEDVEYRYCICTVIEPQHFVIVRQWETHLYPRRINRMNASSTKQSKPEEFGVLDDVTRIDRGWLSRDTVIQFKLFNSPLTIWRPKLANRQLFIKVTPVCLTRHMTEGSVDNLEESLSTDTQEFVEPPAHTVTEVASLHSEDCTFHQQEQFGIDYKPCDFLIFQMSVLNPANVAYLIDLYVYSSHAVDGDPPNHIGFSYVLPSALKGSEGQMVLAVTSVKQRPLGQLSLEYIVVHPSVGSTCDLQVSYARHWKSSWSGLDVGHRGLGTSFKVETKGCAEVRENTIASLKTAASHGADFVEFDVQLSKDHVPVIYHDFHVCISMKKKKQLEETDMLELPVKELTVEQLHLLKDITSPPLSCRVLHYCDRDPLTGLVYHLAEGKDKNPRFFDEHLEEHQPFPTLQQVLEVLDPHVGFNIEIKWTMKLQDGSYELYHPFDLNMYLDTMINVVLKYGGSRRIIFSCFNPDICSMIRLKQNKYPVMFLTQGQTNKYPTYHDPRCVSIESAVQHALCMGLLGVNVHTEDILRDSSQVKLATDAGLVIFCWGDDNNDPFTIKYLKQLGLHGVIYDKIDQYSSKEIKESIFMIEARESQKSELIALAAAAAEAPTSPSAVSSLEDVVDVQRARMKIPAESTATSLESLASSMQNLNHPSTQLNDTITTKCIF